MSKIETDVMNANKVRVAETVIARFFADAADSAIATDTDNDYYPRFFDYLQDAGVLIYDGAKPSVFSPFRNADDFRFLYGFVECAPAWGEFCGVLEALGVLKLCPEKTRAMITRLFAIFVRAKKIKN